MGRDGHVLGAIDRLVVDEAAHRVTHVVVDGHLVGVRRLAPVEGGLRADLTRDELRKLPSAEHDHLGAPGEHWSAPFGWTLSNFLNVTGALIGQAPYEPPVHIDPNLEQEDEITQGSPVWSGNRRLGEVERVFTSEDGSIRELVIRRSRPLAGHARLPGSRITEVVGNNVHTDVAPDEELEPASS
ncbi:MAG TPA: hypothetical protein VF160_08020 [Candidatus Dormibacteraeota bacterium]